MGDARKLIEIMEIWQPLNIAVDDIGCRFSAPNLID